MARSPWYLLALAACTADKSPVDSLAGETADSALGDSAGESSESNRGSSDPGYVPSGVEVTVSEVIPTVLTVTWTTEAPCTGRVTYGVRGEPGRESPAEGTATMAHTRVLVGLPQSADVELTVHCEATDGSGEIEGPPASTGVLPADLDDLVVTGEVDTSGEYLTLPVLGATTGAAIVDLSGRFVWFYPVDSGFQTARAVVSVDGASVLFNQVLYSANNEDQGEITRVSWDGATVERYPVPLNSHDFTELPDGTLAALAFDIRTEGREDILGDKLVEIAPDGTSTTVWSTFDTWSPTAHPSQNRSDDTWTHLNAIDYDAAGDRYWISVRNFNALVAFDRGSGTVTEQIGGYTPTIDWSDPAEAPYGQHQFQMLDDGVLVFDNRMDINESRSVEYSLGTTATERWSYTPDERYFVYALGDVARDDDGGTRITFCTSGEVRQLDANATETWRMNADFGQAFGYSDRLATLYR